MPTQKKKPKQQDAAKPAAATATPLQIKSEPLDIKPLSAFVDDRVELIRQAFMCLKPKEITCLAPDAFQGKSIEFIQEQCLDEVLGISTKRLLSIINSTQCPTDTDSSDEEKITEHISLDEISSDSEVEVKPQPKKKAAKKTKATDGKKMPSTDASNKNGDKKSEKEMTVLELLELQARARAIRSQLAQEPVTKIELDSDEEAEKAAVPPPASKKPSTTNNSSSRAEAVAGTDAGGSSKQSSSSNRTSPAKEQQPKRVRLKRNFRVRQVGDEDVPEEGTQPQPQVEESQKSVSRRESRSKSKEKEKVVEDKPKEEISTKSRDSSPEVIPVIPSPETLCISSDSEEEKERKKKASIFVDNIEELDRQAKEQAKQLEAKKAAEENDDTEEGEISEEERSRKESIGSTKVDEEKKDSPGKDAKLDHEEELDYDEVREVSDSEPDTSGPPNSLNQTDSQPEAKADSADDKSSDSSDSDAESSSSNSSEGEPEVVEKRKKKEAEEDDEDDPDIVEIHDSSDETLLDQKLAEDEPEKSWGSRWLESNRVAKVMAASRLGNKVRDKLKKKKKKQKQDEEDAAAAAKQAEEEKAEAKPAEEPQPVSTAEVGSVEHYNELMSKVEKSTEGDRDEAEKPE